VKIQGTNIPAIQNVDLENASESRTTAKAQQQDVFESQVAASEQAAQTEKEKAHVDHAIDNIEILTPTNLGTPIDTLLSMGEDDRRSVVTQKRLEDIEEAYSEISKASAQSHTIAAVTIKKIRA
jgi:hypothetical protein